MGKRALVAGGAGFLGSHLCARLLGEGYEVVCLDNFETGTAANIAAFTGDAAFHVVEHDIISRLPPLGRFDEIYNLACPASPPHYQRDPVHTLKTSVFGALNLLDKAVDGASRIFQASTSEIYGDPTVHPQPETYLGNVNPFGPRACYDEGKRSAETLFFDYSHRYGTEIRIARIFNTYGPRMRPDDGRVVSNFIVQALRGDDITIYGDGSQTRSFCYVDDLIEGFLRLMQSGYGQPVNLGNPCEFTVAQLAGLVVDITGSSSRIVYRPLPVDDPKQRRPDITLARSKLDWQPSIALTDGLVRTVEYFETQLGNQTRHSLRAPATLAS
jgi:UDP-glucuronate decarboxylase